MSFRQDFKHFGQNRPNRMLYKICNFGLIFKILLSNGLFDPEFSAKTVTSQFPQQTAEKMLKNSQKWWKMKKIHKTGLFMHSLLSCLWWYFESKSSFRLVQTWKKNSLNLSTFYHKVGYSEFF